MSNAERLKAHKVRMRAAGFELISAWVCPELATLLRATRRPGECRGRTLERMILGQAKPRPEYWTEGERQARGVRTPGKRVHMRRRIAGMMGRIEKGRTTES